MKIAYFLDIAEGLGGAGNILLEQARIMSELHEVVVVIPCNKNGIINQEYKARCERAQLKYIGMYYVTAFLLQNIDIIEALDAIENIKNFAVKEKIGFFHSVQLNIAVELVSRELAIPHLMNVYQIPEEEFKLQYADIFPKYHSCDSEMFCEQWRKGLGITSKCIRAVSPVKYIHKKMYVQKKELKLLMLGNVCERKNQLAAIKAVGLCKKRNMPISLTIAGDDKSEYAKVCRKFIIDNELSEMVCLVGFQSNIFPLLEEHDCFLCTSIDESFPSVIVECMTYDLTIISTPVAGVPELMVDGQNAYICKGFEVDDIVESIQECWEDYGNEKFRNIHRNAEKTWENNFKVEVVQRQLNDYYSFIRKDYKLIQNKSDVEELKKEVDSVWNKLMRSNLFEDKIVFSKCYYYNFLRKKMNFGKAYIWGAGKNGKIAKQIMDVLFPEVQVLAFIDKNRKGTYMELPVILPEQMLLDQIDFVIIGFAAGRETAIEFLGEKGFKYNEKVWVLP